MDNRFGHGNDPQNYSIKVEKVENELLHFESHYTVSKLKVRIFMRNSKDTPIFRGGCIGAVLIPNHPAAFPGWTPTEWDSLGKNIHCEEWDLEDE